MKPKVTHPQDKEPFVLKDDRNPRALAALPEVMATVRYSAGVAGALLVLGIGMLVKRRNVAAAG